ncbi:hypothetical protein C3L23_02575 [Nautilia sp. PV-1]|uniref:hypothetical protein n=1 Tax=Nautilia sp. PV-1 TaxID=2579250 RepID=UPI000FD727A6|nr:hypothetical protein [Nautilia sp. PV-1]AZV46194.1 hypothetical protein C3L23_02575 [Nautilia sp. PV-1]
MKSYLNELKVAVINQDLKLLEKIIQNDPEFESIEEAMEIQAYIKEAVKLLQKEKDRLSLEMQKIQNLKKFNNQQKENETFDFKA